MIYITDFSLMGRTAEERFLDKFPMTCFTTYYPFRVFSYEKDLNHVTFDDITIFCGSNGSGKTTLLNIIAEKLGCNRTAPFNKTFFFDPYIEKCAYNMWNKNYFDKGRFIEDCYTSERVIENARIITSDDVFNHILSTRQRNEDISLKRQVIMDLRGEIISGDISRPTSINCDDLVSVDNYVQYQALARKKPKLSKYICKNIGYDERTYSNGENAFKYFTDAIKPNGLYLLDEPENSLSAQLQLDLATYLQGMARSYNCQFIISSHSPFILSIPFAKIYNMDSEPVTTCKWTELPNIRFFHDFFMDHTDEF